MINNISKTPFKVNIALLDYITTDDKHNLLLKALDKPINQALFV